MSFFDEQDFNSLDDTQVCHFAVAIAELTAALLQKSNPSEELKSLVLNLISQLRRCEKLNATAVWELENRLKAAHKSMGQEGETMGDLVTSRLNMSITGICGVLWFEPSDGGRFSLKNSIEHAVEMLESAAEMWADVNEIEKENIVEDLRREIRDVLQALRERRSVSSEGCLERRERFWVPERFPPKLKVDLSGWFEARSWLENREFEKVLHAYKEDPSLFETRSEIGETLLHWFVIENQIDIVRWLEEQGAEVSTVDNFGETAIMHAVKLELRDMTAALLEFGADLDAVSQIDECLEDLLAELDPRWDDIELQVRNRLGRKS